MERPSEQIDPRSSCQFVEHCPEDRALLLSIMWIWKNLYLMILRQLIASIKGNIKSDLYMSMPCSADRINAWWNTNIKKWVFFNLAWKFFQLLLQVFCSSKKSHVNSLIPYHRQFVSSKSLRLIWRVSWWQIKDNVSCAGCGCIPRYRVPAHLILRRRQDSSWGNIGQKRPLISTSPSQL